MKTIRECPKDERWEFVREAVLKATPKKPNKPKDSTYAYCPTCGSTRMDMYCSRCGQKIDWSDN